MKGKRNQLVKPDGQVSRTTSRFGATKKKPPVQIGDSPEWLPSGWKLEITTRRRGATAGHSYKRYFDPFTGSRFYSKREVFRYLESGEPNRKRSIKTNAAGDICTSSSQRRITDDKLTDNLVKPDGQATRTTSDFGATKKKTPLQIGNSPEWLPSGWKLEIITRRSGASAGQVYKRYFDPFTGSRFYSKREVFQYLESGEPNLKRSVKTNAAGDICTSSNQRGVTDDVLECSLDGFPDGWIKVMKIRKANTKHGVRKDRYYIDQVSGYAFQSRKDAFCYIETGEISKYAFRPKKRHTSNMYSIGKEGTPPVAAKRSRTRGNDVRRCLFSAQARNSKMKMMIGHPSVQDYKDADSASIGERVGNKTENLHDAACHGGLLSLSVKKCSQNQGSAKQSRPKKTKTFKIITLPLRSSKRLAGIKADPVVDSEISDRLSRTVTNKSEQHTATPAQGCYLSSGKSDGPKAMTTIGLEFLSMSEGENLGNETRNLHDAVSQGKGIFPQSAGKKHRGHKCGSKEQVGSHKQGSAVQLRPKRPKAFKAITLPHRSSKRLAGIKAASVVDSGISDRHSRTVTNKSEQSTVTPPQGSSGESDGPKATTTVGLELLAKSEGEDPERLPVAPVHGCNHSNGKSDGLTRIGLEFPHKSEGEDHFLKQTQGCDSSSIKSDEPRATPTIGLEFLKKSEGEGLPIEQVSLGKLVGETKSTDDKLESSLILPFGNSWPDPCIEFAFKTLTGDIPVFEDTVSIENYFQQQLMPAPGPSLSGSVSVSFSSPVNYTQPEPGDQLPIQDRGACSTLESRFKSGREADTKYR